MILIKVVCGARYDCDCEILAISYPAYGGEPFSLMGHGNRFLLIRHLPLLGVATIRYKQGSTAGVDHCVENMLCEVQNEISPGP